MRVIFITSLSRSGADRRRRLSRSMQYSCGTLHLKIRLNLHVWWIDLSGWAPKYFPAELVHNVNTLLQDKVMFGSDWPAIGVERWMEEFQQLNLKPEVRQKVLLENAKKFFGLNF